MTMHKKLLLAVAAFSATMVCIAGEVDSNQIITFSPGTPALAADVNANFGVLIAAINDNAQRLTTLEETASNDDQPTNLMELLTGASYKIVGIASVLESGSYDGETSISSQLEAFSQTVTLLEGGTYTSSENKYQERELSFLPSVNCCDDGNFDDPDTTSTWTLSGNVLSLFFNESIDGLDRLEFTVSPDGNILIYNIPGHFNQDSGLDEGIPFEDDNFSATVVIGIRLSQ